MVLVCHKNLMTCGRHFMISDHKNCSEVARRYFHACTVIIERFDVTNAGQNAHCRRLTVWRRWGNNKRIIGERVIISCDSEFDDLFNDDVLLAMVGN